MGDGIAGLVMILGLSIAVPASASAATPPPSPSLSFSVLASPAPGTQTTAIDQPSTISCNISYFVQQDGIDIGYGGSNGCSYPIGQSADAELHQAIPPFQSPPGPVVQTAPGKSCTCNIDGTADTYSPAVPLATYTNEYITILMAPPDYVWVDFPPGCTPFGSTLYCDLDISLVAD